VNPRAYLSIGDVLSLLREEFPDVTISKIRFLESQGLVNPERSPSGYRKFYEQDVERLRWVLRQQRENFLPLKVIRDRLAQDQRGLPESDAKSEAPSSASEIEELPVAAMIGATAVAPNSGTPTAAETATGHQVRSNGGSSPSRTTDQIMALVVGARTAALPGKIAGSSAAAASWTTSGTTSGPGMPGPVAEVPSDTPSPHPPTLAPAPPTSPPRSTSPASGIPSPPPDAPSPGGDIGRGAAVESNNPRVVVAHASHASHASHTTGSPSVADTGADVDEFPATPAVSGASFTMEELCSASGLSVADVDSLEGFGLIESMPVAGILCYDEEALVVAKLVTQFARFGVEPRHLRLYRNAVDREVGLVEQIVTPLLRQRNPEARQRALDAAADMAKLGQGLRASLLRRELRRQLGT